MNRTALWPAADCLTGCLLHFQMLQWTAVSGKRPFHPVCAVSDTQYVGNLTAHNKVVFSIRPQKRRTLTCKECKHAKWGQLNGNSLCKQNQNHLISWWTFSSSWWIWHTRGHIGKVREWASKSKWSSARLQISTGFIKHWTYKALDLYSTSQLHWWSNLFFKNKWDHVFHSA